MDLKKDQEKHGLCKEAHGPYAELAQRNQKFDELKGKLKARHSMSAQERADLDREIRSLTGSAVIGVLV
jgi:hypothetical protein